MGHRNVAIAQPHGKREPMYQGSYRRHHLPWRGFALLVAMAALIAFIGAMTVASEQANTVPLPAPTPAPLAVSAGPDGAATDGQLPRLIIRFPYRAHF